MASPLSFFNRGSWLSYAVLCGTFVLARGPGNLCLKYIDFTTKVAAILHLTHTVFVLSLTLAMVLCFGVFAVVSTDIVSIFKGHPRDDHRGAAVE
jgi:hypothetical protein